MPRGVDEAVVVQSPGGSDLAGCLRLPEVLDGSPMPAALLLAGSGPLDHDGNAPGMPIGIQLALADALAAVGIASLRFDRRGVNDGGDWREASFDDNTDDSKAAWALLAADPRIDKASLSIIGHSEGAVQAVRLAADSALQPAPSAVVLLAASARPGGDVLAWQAERIGGAMPAPDEATRLAQAEAAVAQTKSVQARLLETTTPVADIDGVELNAAWMRGFITYNPATDFPRIGCRVLAVTGDKDLQVPPEDLVAIAARVGGPVETQRPDGISHLLRTDAQAPTLADYKRQLDLPVDAQVLGSVTSWLA